MQIITFGRRLVPDLPEGQSNEREGSCTDHRECDGPGKMVSKMCWKAQADESNMAFPEGVVSVVSAVTPESQLKKQRCRAYGEFVRPVKGMPKRAAKVVRSSH